MNFRLSSVEEGALVLVGTPADHHLNHLQGGHTGTSEAHLMGRTGRVLRTEVQPV